MLNFKLRSVLLLTDVRGPKGDSEPRKSLKFSHTERSRIFYPGSKQWCSWFPKKAQYTLAYDMTQPPPEMWLSNSNSGELWVKTFSPQMFSSH